MKTKSNPKSKSTTGRCLIMIAILAFLVVMPLCFMLIAFESAEIEKVIMLRTSQAPIQAGNISSMGVVGVDNMDPISNMRVKDRLGTISQKSGKRKRIAYAISITKDGFFQDGAAVLAYSILQNSRQHL